MGEIFGPVAPRPAKATAAPRVDSHAPNEAFGDARCPHCEGWMPQREFMDGLLLRWDCEPCDFRRQRHSDKYETRTREWRSKRVMNGGQR